MTRLDDNQVLSQIITACKDGRQDGFSQIVDLYAKRLYGYFYRLTGNAELSNDLLSEVFVKLVEKIKMYEAGSFDLWLFKIASNTFYDHLRRQKREKVALESHRRELEDDSRESSDWDGKALDMLKVRLDQIDEQTRELLLLRYYSELSFKEIAQMKNEPIGTVLSRVHRGLARLRELMEQQYE